MRVVLILVLGFYCGLGEAVGIVSRWVNPSRQGKVDAQWELLPQERTRPIVMGEIVYFGNLSGDVYAVHRTEGYVLWHRKLPKGIEGALTYARSKIFVGDLGGNFYALNSRDGSIAWTFKIEAEWLAPPAVARDRVFAVTSNNELYALSETNGSEIWHYSHKGDEKMVVRGGAGPTVYGSEIFAGFSDGYVVGLATNNGRVLWNRKLRTKERFYDVDSQPFVDEKSVIAATFDGKVYSLDRTNGNPQWSFNVGSYGGFLVEEDKVYFSGLDGNFYALAREGGREVWKTPFDKGVGLTPTRVGDLIAITTSADPMYFLNPKDGKVVAKERLGAGTLAAASGVTDGWLFAMSNYGNLFSYQVMPTMQRFKEPGTIASPSAFSRTAARAETL